MVRRGVSCARAGAGYKASSRRQASSRVVRRASAPPLVVMAPADLQSAANARVKKKRSETGEEIHRRARWTTETAKSSLVHMSLQVSPNMRVLDSFPTKWLVMLVVLGYHRPKDHVFIHTQHTLSFELAVLSPTDRKTRCFVLNCALSLGGARAHTQQDGPLV